MHCPTRLFTLISLQNNMNMLRGTTTLTKAVRLTMRTKSTSIPSADIMKYLTTPPYTLPNHVKLVAPPMVYISGEEMTHYTMNLMYVVPCTFTCSAISANFNLFFIAWTSGSSLTSTLATGSSTTCLARPEMTLTIRCWPTACQPASAWVPFSRSPP